MPTIAVESLVEFRKPYLERLQSLNSPASLIHEGMVGIVARIDIRETPILARRIDRTRSTGPKTRTETRVMVVWERSEAQGGGTWTAHYPISALKIAK